MPAVEQPDRAATNESTAAGARIFTKINLAGNRSPRADPSPEGSPQSPRAADFGTAETKNPWHAAKDFFKNQSTYFVVVGVVVAGVAGLLSSD